MVLGGRGRAHRKARRFFSFLSLFPIFPKDVSADRKASEPDRGWTSASVKTCRTKWVFIPVISSFTTARSCRVEQRLLLPDLMEGFSVVVIRSYMHIIRWFLYPTACTEELLPKGCAQLEQLRSKVKDELFSFVWFSFLTLWRFSNSAK